MPFLDINQLQTEVHYPEKTLLLWSQVKGRFLGVVHSGEVKMVMYPEGNLRGTMSFFPLMKVSSHGFFGELSLCDSSPTYPTYIAITSGNLSVLPLESQYNLLEENPRLGVNLLIEMHRRLLAYQERYEALRELYRALKDLSIRLLLHTALDKVPLEAPLQKQLLFLKQQAKKHRLNPLKGGAFTMETRELLRAFEMPNITADIGFIHTFFDHATSFIMDSFRSNPKMFAKAYELIGRESHRYLEGIDNTCRYTYKELRILIEGDGALLRQVAQLKTSQTFKWTHQQVEAVKTLLSHTRHVLLNNSSFLESLFDIKAMHTTLSQGLKALMQQTLVTNIDLDHLPSTISVPLGRLPCLTPALLEEVNEVLSELNMIKSVLDASDKERKWIRRANQVYLKIYTQVVLYLFETHANLITIPKEIALFVRYNVINVKAVSEKTRSFLEGYQDHYVSTDSTVIVTLYEWLEYLYTREEEPSNTHLGISYTKYLEEHKKKLSRKKREALPIPSQKEEQTNMVEYEMNHLVVSSMKISSESPMTTLFLLTKINEPNDIQNYLLSKEGIHKAFSGVREKDFSLFYRETLFRISKNVNDIIREEFLPYVIILPTIGNKAVFWQDIKGSNKRSKARFAVPYVFTGNLNKAICRACAEYRWEICRSIKGHLWSSAVDGGITGAFYDYVMGYKKNSKLSVEAKEKIKKLLASNRKDNKRLFISYYMIWIENESQGVMKLDAVARDIFFRHIPFKKAIRSQLEKLPAYQRLTQRHAHQAYNMITSLKGKYQKYAGKHGELPPELQQNMHFYTL